MEWLLHVKVEEDASGRIDAVAFNPKSVFVRSVDSASLQCTEGKENTSNKGSNQSLTNEFWDKMQVSETWSHLLDD
nr:unnamed protein product [Spirometra erinaceieuropaei]